MPGIPIKWIVIGTILIAVVTAVGLGYNHYNNLVKENVTLHKNNTELKAAVEVQKQTIKLAKANAKAWRESFDRWQATLDALVTVNQQASQELTRLNRLFAKHDIERLAQAKPTLIQRRINRGTARALSMFERATSGNRVGSPRATGSTKATTDPGSAASKDETGGVGGDNKADAAEER